MYDRRWCTHIRQPPLCQAATGTGGGSAKASGPGKCYAAAVRWFRQRGCISQRGDVARGAGREGHAVHGEGPLWYRRGAAGARKRDQLVQRPPRRVDLRSSDSRTPLCGVSGDVAMTGELGF